MPLLAIETATNICSVALGSEDALLASVTFNLPRRHAEKLAPSMAYLLQETGVRAEDLRAVAVSAGPGSYTGLRIGVSTAKGLAFAHDLPLIAVSTLEALASQIQPFARKGDIVLVALDARQGELYAALFEVTDPSPEAPLKRLREETALTVEALREWLPSSRTLWLAGEGIHQLLTGPVPDTWHPLSPDVVYPRAEALLHLAWRAYREGRFEDLASFEPRYLRAFRTHPPKSLFARSAGSGQNA